MTEHILRILNTDTLKRCLFFNVSKELVYLDLFCRGVGEKTNKFAQAYYKVWASQVAQWVKNLPAVQETKVLEDPLEEGMATYSSIVA